MNQTAKYFLINKEEDFKEGLYEAMRWNGGGIECTAVSQEKGIFFSGTLNSMEREMEWHRLTINGGEKIAVPFKISVYSCDRDVWEERIKTADLTLEEKLALMESYLQKSEWNASDLLLHDVKGQYLWVGLEVYGPVTEDHCFMDIKVFFPRKSWIRYLPEIYQKEDSKLQFLERYLGIFQTLYEDLNEKIDSISDRYDFAITDEKMLHWMADWLDIEESQIFSEERLRILLSKAVLFFKNKGTRNGMKELVEFYIEEECFLIENYQIDSQYKRLYPGNSAGFSVIVRECALTGGKTKEGLMQVIEMMRPVQAACHLIILNPYLFLGGYAYLGINSGMERLKAPVLSENAVVSLTMLGIGT